MSQPTMEPVAQCGAAFFDVDGTLVNATIAHYLRYFNLRRMSPWRGRAWYATFLLRCGVYMLLDRIDRGKLNVIFYRNYAGLPVREIKALAQECHRDVIIPRQLHGADATLQQHRAAGRAIILVTGSLDFIMEPFARQVGATATLAGQLAEANGCFTGTLIGPPVGGEEKARRVRQYARECGIDLTQSYAYGDSIADLPMLECVGRPHAVNPDRALRRVARRRNWPILSWT